MRSPQTTDYAEFRENLAAHLRRMRRAKGPTLVTRNGKAEAVVLSPADFALYEEAREHWDAARAVEQSRIDFAAGRSMSVAAVRKRLPSSAPSRKKP